MLIINAYDVQPFKFINFTMNRSRFLFSSSLHTPFLIPPSPFPIYTTSHHIRKPFTLFPIILHYMPYMLFFLVMLNVSMTVHMVNWSLWIRCK